MAGVFHSVQVCVALQLLLSFPVLPAASATRRNYYETLNVEPTATDSQIKKNFRKLALKYHPDKSKSADAEKAFREIVEAYQVLSNKEKRRLYDSVGHAAFLQDDAPADPQDEHVDDFLFTFADLLSPFLEEPSFHWSFDPFEDEEDALYQHYSIEGSVLNLYFGEENEDQLF